VTTLETGRARVDPPAIDSDAFSGRIEGMDESPALASDPDCFRRTAIEQAVESTRPPVSTA
jgi:hypothetical protein